jgi:hypothetical protein
MNMTANCLPLYFLSPVMTRTGRSSEKQRRFGLVAKLHCLGQRNSACTVEIVQAPGTAAAISPFQLQRRVVAAGVWS